MLNDEIEENGDFRTTNEMCPSLVGSLGLSCRYQRFCHALAALVGPIQNMFSLLDSDHFIQRDQRGVAPADC